MTHYISTGYVGFSKQTVPGTAVAPTSFFRWTAMKATPVMKSGFVRDAQNRDVAFSWKGQQYGEGSFSSFMTPDEFTKLFAYTIGATDGVTGMADPYTHAGTSAQTTPQLLTLEYSQGAIPPSTPLDVVRVTDCYVKELKATSKAGELVKVDVNWVGRIPVPGGTPATLSYSVDRPLQASDATPVFTGVSVAGGDITELVLDIKQDILMPTVHGSIIPQLIPGKRDISVDFTVLCSDTHIFRDIWFGGDTGTAAVVGLTTVSSIVANWDIAGSPDHAVQLTISNVDLIDGQPSFDPNLKEFTVAAKGTAKYVSGTPILAYSSKNAVATAY